MLKANRDAANGTSRYYMQKKKPSNQEENPSGTCLKLHTQLKKQSAAGDSSPDQTTKVLGKGGHLQNILWSKNLNQAEETS